MTQLRIKFLGMVETVIGRPESCCAATNCSMPSRTGPCGWSPPKDIWWFFTRDGSVCTHPRSHHLVPGLRLEQTPKTNFWTPLRGFALLTVHSVLLFLILLFPLFPHVLYSSVSAILLLSLCSTYHTTDSSATHLLYAPLVFPSHNAYHNSKRDPLQYVYCKHDYYT